MAGKLVVFHHNLPVAEAPGKLKNRDDRKCLGTEKAKTVLTPQTKFYNDLGKLFHLVRFVIWFSCSFVDYRYCFRPKLLPHPIKRYRYTFSGTLSH